ncbi:MAG: thiol protease/hemagglutinin PrtT [Flavobacteriales bacterium]|nr:thiol protease/hemagglutinin PrtT [Flavobacteriales bacterium]MCB9447254.1 thiol protease/hemagglutinin PrtT [Flavobacteriales bacterium]
MKRILLSAAFLMGLAHVNMAGTVTPERAQSVASHFLQSGQPNALNKVAPKDAVLAYTETLGAAMNNAPAYYVFNDPSGKGFVIVAGDDLMEPILAYSRESRIDMNQLSPPFKAWMNRYKVTAQNMKATRRAASAEVQNMWNDATRLNYAGVPVVEPLIRARWNQFDPYNAMCPAPGGSTQRAPTGCVATAMAQIMYYWRYPNTGQGSKSYTPDGYPKQTVDFSKTSYGWGYMRDIYDPGQTYTQTERNSVATLMYHAGVSVSMEYGTTSEGKGSGSSAKTASAATAYAKYFRYPSTTSYKKRSSYSVSSWISLLKSELDQFRPMQIRGSDPVKGGGHSWVCDGYDNLNLFHFNWGWGGPEGYFNMSTLDFTFKSDVAVVTGIEKPNRLTISNVTSSVNVICSAKTFTCSVPKQSNMSGIFWTVPSGWKVGSVVSTGQPIRASFSVTISTPSSYSPTGGYVVISASGIAYSGERTLTRSVLIGTGKPSFTYRKTLDVGSAEHCFLPSPGASIQFLVSGKWVSGDACIELFNGAIKTVTVRATNGCGSSSGVTYKLTSPIDKQILYKSGDAMEEAALSIYPNPTHDYIRIRSASDIQGVRCFNAIGEMVNVESKENNLSVAHLPNGVYFLYITLQDGQKEIRKFIKE